MGLYQSLIQTLVSFKSTVPQTQQGVSNFDTGTGEPLAFIPKPDTTGHPVNPSSENSTHRSLRPHSNLNHPEFLPLSTSSPADIHLNQISSFAPSSFQSNPPHSLHDRIIDKPQAVTVHTQKHINTMSLNPSQPQIEVEGWTPWPDGDFSRLFSNDEVAISKQIMVHWATLTHAYQGNPEAVSWPQGRRSVKKCLGVVRCQTPDCAVRLRPTTRTESMRRLLSSPCKCGGSLCHIPCDVKMVIHEYLFGRHFEHKGTHDHPRPHPIHLDLSEQRKLAGVVRSHPKAGPSKLMAGVPDVNGTSGPVTELSTTLLNSDRVKYEVAKIRRQNPGNGGDVIGGLVSFCEEHPNFVLYSTITQVAVISMQSTVLAGAFIKELIPNEAINGIVSDATHGYWQNENALLIISSTYSPVLQCWVPGVFSYSNGASAEHYAQHFFALFTVMSNEADQRGVEITDTYFANVSTFTLEVISESSLNFNKVVDFSAAQRNGFIEAFIRFWREKGTALSRDELASAAKSLLKGCREHFRAAVTRIKRISAVIPPEEIDLFESMALGLLNVDTPSQFHSQALDLIHKFPLTRPWMSWWMQPSSASMLFESHRMMDINLWNSLPATTNAEEAMHFRIKMAIGYDMSFLDGLDGLYRFTSMLELKMKGSLGMLVILYDKMCLFT